MLVINGSQLTELIRVLGFNFEIGAAVTFNTEDRAVVGGCASMGIS